MIIAFSAFDYYFHWKSLCIVTATWNSKRKKEIKNLKYKWMKSWNITKIFKKIVFLLNLIELYSIIPILINFCFVFTGKNQVKTSQKNQE